MKYVVGVASVCLLMAVAAAQDVMPVQRPEVKVGESWTYVDLDSYSKQAKGEWRFEVVGVDDASIKTELQIGGRKSARNYGRDWSVGSNFQLFSFPLEIGKKWKSTTTYDSNCGRTTDDLEAEVKGWEDIEVPAGKFTALRIEHNGSYTGTQCAGGQKNRWYWYVPSLKRFVRVEQRSYSSVGRLEEVQVLELKASKVH